MYYRFKPEKDLLYFSIPLSICLSFFLVIDGFLVVHRGLFGGFSEVARGLPGGMWGYIGGILGVHWRYIGCILGVLLDPIFQSE